MDFERAKLLHERGQLDEAIQIYDQLLNKNFADHGVLFYYGTAVLQQGKTGLAANLLARAIEFEPTQAAPYQNLGNAFKTEGNNRDAEAMYRMALERGETAELWTNIGGMYVNNGTPSKALEHYEKALKLNPTNKTIKFNMSFPYLELGMWEKGWDCYEAGFVSGDRKTRHYENIPEWDGSPGKTVIVWGEQGVGDEIMFASCIPDLQKVAKNVIFDCHPRLVKTFERSFGIECHGTRKTQYLDWLPSSGADASICVSTLSKMYRKSDADFPGTAFIKPDQEEVAKLRTGSKPRIGISWVGGSKQTNGNIRSMSLDKLLPILKKDADFYSLQYTPDSAKQVCELEEKYGVHVKHYPGLVECNDYDKTVNFIASMDLVISVCTTAIHAAGSLGVPCWILTPNKPTWRYGIKGNRMPWYNSVRLKRQGPNETWEMVIKRVAEELDAYLRNLPRAK